EEEDHDRERRSKTTNDRDEQRYRITILPNHLESKDDTANSRAFPRPHTGEINQCQQERQTGTVHAGSDDPRQKADQHHVEERGRKSLPKTGPRISIGFRYIARNWGRRTLGR